VTLVHRVVTCARRLRRTCVAAMCSCRRLREYIYIYIYIYIYMEESTLASQNASSFVLVSKYFCTREPVLLNLDLEVGFADLN
jgi:hypothetical protein